MTFFFFLLRKPLLHSGSFPNSLGLFLSLIFFIPCCHLLSLLNPTPSIKTEFGSQFRYNHLWIVKKIFSLNYSLIIYGLYFNMYNITFLKYYVRFVMFRDSESMYPCPLPPVCHVILYSLLNIYTLNLTKFFK